MERRHGEIKPFEAVLVVIVLTIMALAGVSIVISLVA